MSDVKFCIFKPLSLSCCNNWFVILIRMSIFLLIQWNVHFHVNTTECPFSCYIIQCYCLPHEKQNTKGNYSYSKWWSVAFHSSFGCFLSVSVSCHIWKQIGAQFHRLSLSLSKHSGLGNNFPLHKICLYAMQTSLQQLSFYSAYR